MYQGLGNVPTNKTFQHKGFYMLTPTEELSAAILIAITAHDTQLDKGGKPYIGHPIHVMSQLLPDMQLASVGVLHDVLEDSHYIADDLLKCGISKRVVDAVVCLTHVDGETYSQYIDRVSTSKDAMIVKLEDLKHNSDLTRLEVVSERDIKRSAKYTKCMDKLQKIVDKV